MNNEIYIRRKAQILIPKNKTGDISKKITTEHISNMQANLERLGYSLSKESIREVKKLRVDTFKDFYRKLIKNIRDVVGDYFIYKPMYPNFPDQVQKMSNLELYSNAAIHYFGDSIGEIFLPNYQVKKRRRLTEKTDLKFIKTGDKEDFESIFSNLFKSNASYSETDKSDIEKFIKSNKQLVWKLLPKEFTFRENKVFIASLLFKYTENPNKFLYKNITTATDVLRLAVAFSDGDISLSKPSKYKLKTKRERKILLELLNRCGETREDFLRYPEEWKRLGERLHPREFSRLYPKVNTSFAMVRGGDSYPTFNIELSKAKEAKNIKLLIELFKKRPGEFARQLDYLIRVYPGSQELIIKEFSFKLSEVSTKLIVEMIAHFSSRSKTKELRVFFPKGKMHRAYALENKLAPFSAEVIQRINSILESELISRFSKLDRLNNVFIDPLLRNYTVPLNQRAASKSLRTVAVGSKMNLPDSDTVRFFLYWKDGKTRTDIDLSILALGENYEFISTISYFNLKDYGAHHSGDITSAPNGASEFIDISIKKFKELNVRYVLMSINSFTQQAYKDLPICFAGFMSRKSPNSGEIFEPKTVNERFDLTSDTRIAIPLIVDLHERKVIWTDLALEKNPNYINNVSTNFAGISLMCRAMTNLEKPNIYDLIKLHAQARGTLVDNKKDADIVFGLDGDVTPYDTDIILSEYLK